MATLAKDLHNRGIRLVDPHEEHNERVASIKNQAVASAVVREAEQTGSESEAESEEENESITMPSTPTSILKSSKKSPSADLAKQLNTLSINGPIQTINGGMNDPMLSGRWEKWDHDRKIMNGFCLMRMMLRGGIKQDDFQFVWKDKRTFVIRLKWPAFFQNPTWMASLDIKQDAMNQDFEVYPATHEVYNSMGVNSKKLESKDGHVYTEGVFYFERDMMTDESKYVPEVFHAPCDAAGNKCTILQILFHEKNEYAKPFASPVTIKESTIRFSKLPPAPAAAAAPAGAPSPAPAAAPSPAAALLSAAAAAAARGIRRGRSDADATAKKKRKTNVPPSPSQPRLPQLDPDLWLPADETVSRASSFHSFDDDSIVSSAIDPIRTFHEAKSYLDELEEYMSNKE